jgi:S-adenosylmethionine-diacylgycerolhomoserine-N-methlytransferase
MPTSEQTIQNLQFYYRFHSAIYDLTRWTFLFGRKRIITKHLDDSNDNSRILEVGCGTGINLHYLHQKYPQAELTGVDISEDMLRKARKKNRHFKKPAELLGTYYQGDLFPGRHFDLVLFSYSLSMMNPGWYESLQNAHQHIGPGGKIAVVDFMRTDHPAFRKWMGINHVRMDDHLLPVLNKFFKPVSCDVKKAYGGLWEYLIYVGEKV